MNYSRACFDLVAEFEGLKLEAYPDPGGVWTIGRGHTRDVKPGMCCTVAQADEWLVEDLDETARLVSAAVRVPLTQPQFDALASFAFNVKGWSGSTLLLLVNEGKYVAAAEEFPKWDHCDGREVAGLLRRREREQALFLS